MSSSASPSFFCRLLAPSTLLCGRVFLSAVEGCGEPSLPIISSLVIWGAFTQCLPSQSSLHLSHGAPSHHAFTPNQLFTCHMGHLHTMPALPINSSLVTWGTFTPCLPSQSTLHLSHGAPSHNACPPNQLFTCHMGHLHSMSALPIISSLVTWGAFTPCLHSQSTLHLSHGAPSHNACPPNQLFTCHMGHLHSMPALPIISSLVTWGAFVTWLLNGCVGGEIWDKWERREGYLN